MNRCHPKNEVMGRLHKQALIAGLLLIIVSGCASYDFARIRNEETDRFQQTLVERTEEILSASETLGLQDCIQIALENNLQLKAKEIEKEISRLDRQVAFSHFLPRVELSLGATAWHRTPMRRVGENAQGTLWSQMNDREITEAVWKVQQPIFVPMTWQLYSIYQRGEEISHLVVERTRQMLTLQVTVLYYQSLALEEAERALLSDLKEADTLLAEMQAFEREGLVMPADRADVETLWLLRKNALNENQRARQLLQSELLSVMGLSPFAPLRLHREPDLTAPEGDLEEQVLYALLNRQELGMADRDVAIQQEQVKIAIAEFLPKLFGFTSLTNTSDSFLRYQNYWLSGLSGVMTLFNGFANVHQYRAARQQEQAAFLRREEACLTVMVQVQEARLNLDAANDQLALAEKNHEATLERWSDLEAQWREGLIAPSERLQMITRRDQAEVQLLLARFQHQVAVAALVNTLGQASLTSEEENS